MKVKELIEKLKDQDPEAELIIEVDPLLVSLEDSEFALSTSLNVLGFTKFYIYNNRYYSSSSWSYLDQILKEDFEEEMEMTPTDEEVVNIRERLSSKEGVVLRVDP